MSFMGMHGLRLEVRIDALDVAVAYLQRLMELTGSTMPVAGIKLTIRHLHWANLESLCPLLDSIRCIAFLRGLRAPRRSQVLR